MISLTMDCILLFYNSFQTWTQTHASHSMIPNPCSICQLKYTKCVFIWDTATKYSGGDRIQRGIQKTTQCQHFSDDKLFFVMYVDIVHSLFVVDSNGIHLL